MANSLLGEPQDIAPTRSQLEEVEATAGSCTTAEAIAAAISKAVGLFRGHNQKAAQAIARRQAELQPTIDALNQTLELTADGIQLAVAQLEQLSVQLRRACLAKDDEQRRLALMTCLQLAREETIRQTASIENLRDVRRQLSEPDGGEPAVASPASVDPITGLPARQPAEQALLSQRNTGRAVYVAVFVLPRLHAVASRYGQSAFDKVLLQFSQYVAQRIGERDKLFRWGQTAFVGLFERQATASEFNAEIQSAIPTKIESFVDTRFRTVMFVTHCQWTSFPLAPGEPAASLISRIETFVHKASD